MQFKHYCNHSCHYCTRHNMIMTTMIILAEKGRRGIMLQQSTRQVRIYLNLKGVS